MNRENIENILLKHCYNMSILKENAPFKKKESILDSLSAAIYRSDMKGEDVEDCILDVIRDTVIDLSFFEKGGDIKDFIDKKWLKFAMALWRQRSAGLGTPNAASGEGELMFIFLSKHITKPTKGDLLLNGTKIELKGEDVRVTGKIGGKTFREKTIKVCRKFCLEPNEAFRTKLEACEIEKVQHLDYWQKELDKLSTLDKELFLTEWLRCIDKNAILSSNVLNDGEFIHKNFVKDIVKLLYKSMIEDGAFDKFVLLGDGTEGKILEGNCDYFNNKIDNDELEILGDYFRINQAANIGWYIK